jgi:hypothetical protein
MTRVEASGVVNAEADDLFHFTDWCYNDPIWAPSIRKAWITRLTDENGLGKVSHYVGTIMGREDEWEGEASTWRPGEAWGMRATTGRPAKMKMQNEMRFQRVGLGKVKVTCSVEYRVRIPVIGTVLDHLYLRSRAQEHVNNAIEGMTRAADRHEVLPLRSHLERRKLDHQGYQPPKPLSPSKDLRM